MNVAFWCLEIILNGAHSGTVDIINIASFHIHGIRLFVKCTFILDACFYKKDNRLDGMEMAG